MQVKLNPHQTDLKENLISQVAELSLAHYLNEVEQVNVEVHSNPLRLIQGVVESITIAAEGLVMQKNLRIEALDVVTKEISINPWSAVFGKIELAQPAHANVQVLLNEEDINQAFHAQYSLSKINEFNTKFCIHSYVFDPQQVKLQFLAEKRIKVNATIECKATGEMIPFSVTATPSITEDRKHIVLEKATAEQSEQIPELITVLLNLTKEMLDFNRFELAGIALQLKALDVQLGKVLIIATAEVEQLPFLR